MKRNPYRSRRAQNRQNTVLYRHATSTDETGMPKSRQHSSTDADPVRNADRWFLAVLAATTLLALALRLYRIGYESLDMDELVQVKGYSHSPYALVIWAAMMGQPVLDYLIGATIWRAGLAESDVAVRIPAALFGAGSVMLLGLWSRQIAGRSVGITAALFLAVCPFHIILSQQARQYTIFVFVALATLMLLDRARRLRNTPAWILFSVSFLALLMTRWVGPHIVAIAIAGYTVAMWGASHRSGKPILLRRERRNLYATTTAMALPYALSIPVCVLIMQLSRGAVSPNLLNWTLRAGDHLADAFLATLAGFSARTIFRSHSPEGWFLIAALSLMTLGSVLLVWRACRGKNRPAAIFLASLFSFPVIFASTYACLTGAIPKPQYLLLMVLPICLCLAISAKALHDAIAKRSPLAGKLAFAAIVSGVALNMYSSSIDCLQARDKRDWRAAMTYLRDHASESDMFAVAASDSVPAAYAPLPYGKHRYGIPHAKFLPIRQTTSDSVLAEEKWSKRASATWLLVYTDRMYVGYDQIRPPVVQVPAIQVHRFNGLFLIESRSSVLAADQLMDAIALLYQDLPDGRSLIAPALLRARYLEKTGHHSQARISLDLAFRQCRDNREVTALRDLIASHAESINRVDARADRTTTP